MQKTVTGWFKPGQAAFNKGRKGVFLGGAAAEACQFKNGHTPWNYQPVGSERVNSCGYVDLKVADPNKWKSKHAVIWEKHNGPAPRGQVVIFGDGNKRNFDLNNLILVLRVQLAVLNRKKLIQNDVNNIHLLVQQRLYYGVMGSLGEKYLDYHRVITAMDQQIGRVLSELDRLGIADNTIVVYTSDNGYFWGEKELIDKRFPYEEATRIPLIVRYPAKIKNPGRTSAELTLSVDLAPTLLQLAGLKAPETMQGVSLSPLLANGNVRLRDSIHMEYFKDFPYNVPAWDAVRTDRFLSPSNRALFGWECL